MYSWTNHCVSSSVPVLDEELQPHSETRLFMGLSVLFAVLVPREGNAIIQA